MDDLLYLTQRIPYPADKGDKITTFNILKQLQGRCRVHLGTFVDDSQDLRHLDALDHYCASKKVVRLHPALSTMRATFGLISGQSLSERYFYRKEMEHWVHDTIRSRGISKILIYSSAMAQYVMWGVGAGIYRYAHIADIDSEKWRQYSKVARNPIKWIYAREAKRLRAVEQDIAKTFDWVSLVTEREVNEFVQHAPESVGRVSVVRNGTDATYFDPLQPYKNPYAQGVRPLVFTGVMDYFPNVEAVEWFARHILPGVRNQVPEACFAIVGSKPVSAVRQLARIPGVVVTGRVDDVRPYLQHAEVSVAPLRIARGIQNKVLEALAMGLPVVATSAVIQGLEQQTRAMTLCADDEKTFIERVVHLLRRGDQTDCRSARRQAVIDEYGWVANLAPLMARLQLIPV